MRRLKNGFSLLELLIAVVILTAVVTGTILTIINCLMLNETNSNIVSASNDAQYVLEQMKALSYGDLSGYTAPTLNNLQNENITLNTSIGATVSNITVTVSWQERQSNRSFSLSTYIAK